MKKLFFFCIFLMSVAASATDYTRYVNPLVGTESSYALSTGNTYPAIAQPWGMNFWTPQTGLMGDGWQYTYTAHRIRGFKQTHQPSPWINDYGQFSIMPTTGQPLADQEDRASWFSHKAEVALPHYYQVYLAEHDVNVELTPTERAAMFRFTFPEAQSYVCVDAFDRGSHVRIIPERQMIVGYSTRNSGGVPSNFRDYFVVVFDKPFSYQATFTAPEGQRAQLAVDVLQATAHHTGAIIGFHTRCGEQVHARVASSFISEEQALRNLEELGADSFDAVRDKGRDSWNEVLGRIEVEGGQARGGEADLRTFYSCLYRSLLFPRRFYEIDANGQPVHYSPYNGKVLPGYLYTDTGFWDTFRCLFPLLNLLYPSESARMQEGLLNAYRESGLFPEWASPGHRDCMVGNNSASVLADAFVKGLAPTDTATLYEGLVHATTTVHPEVSSTGRLGHDFYNRLGYVPCDAGINENAARTLEYSYDDWCILQVAKAIGRPKKEIRELEKRALNYRNLFNSKYNLMCGRKANGEFAEPFSPLKWGGDFTEGNSWHYTWSVFHDPEGLIRLMGGPDTFTAMLDSVFAVPPVFDDSYYGQVIHEIREMTVMNMGNYAHGNQPIQHMIYLYNWVARPWKAQAWLRQVMTRMYTDLPDGYCGDEDNGQTSAWYVWSALGMYPVCPGTTQYALGSPLFKKATLHFENGKHLTLLAPANTPDSPYVQKLTIDGEECTKNYLEHSRLLQGATINFSMSGTPNLQRGTQEADLPYSFSREK